MPKVSILMPACNVENFLRECMDSVVNQTLKDIEIICLDDGSKDSTGNILDEYAAKDSRIKVIHKPNSGSGHSRNVGLDHATGEYIGIIETDDFADPDMFEKLYITAKENNASTPANWIPCEPIIMPPPRTFEDLVARNEQIQKERNGMNWYLSFKNPKNCSNVENKSLKNEETKEISEKAKTK